jgi:hypothetical protein
MAATTWMRLEPRTRLTDDLSLSLRARVLDPMWMLTRQWQLREFQGEDAGSPASAAAAGECFGLTRYQPTGGAAQAYAPATRPLETLVEHEQVVMTGSTTRLSADAGLRFLRMLDRALPPGLNLNYRPDYVALYPLPNPPPAPVDADTSRYLSVMAGRAPDGAQLYAALKAAAPNLPANPKIAPGHIKEVEAVAAAWLAWCDGLFSEPAEAPAWQPPRMEYQFALGGKLANGTELTLQAPTYRGEELDWYSFDASYAAMGSTAQAVPMPGATVPSPATFPGMPAPRWWQLDDAAVDFGAMDIDSDDLSRLVLMDFAVGYGNNWFTIPLKLPVGSVCHVSQVDVTDVFGQVTSIKPYRQVDAATDRWRMFGLTPVTGAIAPAGAPDLATFLYLPPTLVRALDGAAVEDVLFLRDDMATMAWGIEHAVESPLGAALDRVEAYQHAQPTPAPPAGTSLSYLLARLPPNYWIPLISVRTSSLTPTAATLQRGAVLPPDPKALPIPPLGRILEPGHDLVMYDHEVPRSGIRVTRRYRYARWSGGTVHLWAARNKKAGRGQGSSGLRFDLLERS